MQVDHQGSVISVADAAGNAIEVNSYDEYGIPSGSNIGRFQYTGQAWLPELGMYHYKARVYSPMLGRFLQTDPVGYKDQVNLYVYVANDPINSVDPSGEYTCTTSMTKEQCTEFESAQKEAEMQIRSELAQMRSLSDAIRRGRTLTASQRQTQARLDKYLGKGAGTNPVALKAIIKVGERMVGALQGSKPFMYVSKETSAYAQNKPNVPGTVYPSFFGRGRRDQAFTMAHESAHEIRGIVDLPANGGIGRAYGQQNAERIGSWGFRTAHENAENWAYAFGFGS